MNKRPELLWKKESTDANAFFVDIFENVRSMEVYDSINEANTNQKSGYLPKKDNKLSSDCRKDGNLFYVRKDYKKAIEMYNRALCHADINSEHMSFAYGNRSLCFYEMEMFDKCLTDIQLAKKANYPEDLVHKLNNREAKCLERIAAGVETSSSILPKLSFDEHSDIPNMANILTVKNDDQYGRHIVTDGDIDVDQTILIETPLSHVLIGSEYTRCSHCFRENMNFIACKVCVNAMFCDAHCELDPYHRYECNLYKLFSWEQDSYFRNMLQLMIRLTLMGVVLTRTLTVDGLMQLVADCTNDNETKTAPVADQTIPSTFKTLLKLSCYIPAHEKQLYDVMAQLACLSYDLLLDNSEIRKTFATVKHQRFLMHMTFHLCGVFKTNRMTLGKIMNINSSIHHGQVEYYGLAVYNLASYFNHACVPNVACQIHDDLLVWKAIKPIKKGEQLYIDYMDFEVDTPKAERRGNLRDVYGFLCACELCLLSGQMVSSSAILKSDPNFVFVEQNFRSVMASQTEILLNEVKEKAVQFLQSFGRQQPCREILLIQKYLSVLMQVLKK